MNSLLQRSKSCTIKRSQKQSKQRKSKQFALHNNKPRLSLVDLRHIKKPSQSTHITKNNSSSPNFKHQISSYIQKRSDIQIINYYDQYKQQFFRKSLSLQSLLYEEPQIKQKYLTEQNVHFFKGFQQKMLSLFRRKVIVPGSYSNMREQAVLEIQKWVLSWIKRQKLYQKATQAQNDSMNQTQGLLDQIKQYALQVRNQKVLF